MVPRSEFEVELAEMVNVIDHPENPDSIGPGTAISLGAAVYLSVFCTLLIMSFLIMCIRMSYLGQKTRTPAQRRMYAGSRARPSLSQTEPTIYVSPSNLPPPPKYECLAPPSYEEVVGIHYPQYQVQPITQPIATAMSQSTSNANVTNSVNVTNESPPTIITVTSEARRTSVQVAAS
ncbi:hypothetical protein MSG28_012818 [Choristoneura fumiferana]|uniref:Uncharacterized protein n=1 Tax=Choristoneura fumiferana TaxID=7141 RepID=A0ACC0JI72_CHOFU|nr:hypothetical protein MSG28_012818 [Choristoneura fumiferana]